MCKGKIFIPALIVSVTWVSSVSAQRFNKIVTGANSVYVRTEPDGFIIGTLLKAGGNGYFSYDLNSAGTVGHYRWGTALGGCQKCGWVNISYFSGTPTVLPQSCGLAGPNYPNGADNPDGTNAGKKLSRQYLLNTWARCVNDYVTNPAGNPYENHYTGDGTDMRTLAGVDVWGNYSGGYFWDKVGWADYQSLFYWRWVSNDGVVVLGRALNSAVWGYIPRWAVDTNLKYSDNNFRNDIQGESN